MNLSEHFKLSELTKTSYADYTRLNDHYARENISKLQVLAKTILEPCRAICGPLIVTSGVRCPELNEKVKGVKTSQHCLCEAADVVPSKMNIEEAFLKIAASDIPYGQLILECINGSKWIHVSLGYPYRPKSKCRQKFIYDGKTYKEL
jgi:uncharacterized protein YcbK (DUF882 family)